MGRKSIEKKHERITKNDYDSFVLGIPLVLLLLNSPGRESIPSDGTCISSSPALVLISPGSAMSVPEGASPLKPSTISSKGVPCLLILPPLGPRLLPFRPVVPEPGAPGTPELGAGLERLDAEGVELRVFVLPRNETGDPTIPGVAVPSPPGGGVIVGGGVAVSSRRNGRNLSNNDLTRPLPPALAVAALVGPNNLFLS